MHNDATLLLFHVQEMAKKVIDKRSFVHTYNQEYCLVAYSLYQRLPRLLDSDHATIFVVLATLLFTGPVWVRQRLLQAPRRLSSLFRLLQWVAGSADTLWVSQWASTYLFTALGVFCTLKTTSARIIHFAEVSIHLCELLDAISDAAAA